jgi:hypothetical protein
MSRHRAEPPRRPAPPAARRHADSAKPRYGRLAVLGAAVSVTGIAMLGGVGVLPSVASGGSGGGPASDSGQGVNSALAGAATTPSVPPSSPSSTPSGGAGKDERAGKAADQPLDQASDQASDQADTDPGLPAGSGEGKRIVFDQSDQRVWLVDDDDTVTRTYLVSGSVTDNLDPGTYSVYSRSEDAVGIDDSGTMKYFVRFTQGPTGAAIGFHDIPIYEGRLVQTAAQLGTPQSHGCIRQQRPNAIALWNFAPIGTEVDVTA